MTRAFYPATFSKQSTRIRNILLKSPQFFIAVVQDTKSNIYVVEDVEIHYTDIIDINSKELTDICVQVDKNDQQQVIRILSLNYFVTTSIPGIFIIVILESILNSCYNKMTLLCLSLEGIRN